MTTTNLKVNYLGPQGMSRDITLILLDMINKTSSINIYFTFKLCFKIVAYSFQCLISDRNIRIAYLILHPITVSGDLEIQPNLIETIWKWELKFKVLKWFQHDCFQQLERKGEV